MMTRTHALMILTSFALVVACGAQPEHDVHDEPSQASTAPVASHPEHDILPSPTTSHDLVLNDGEKWPMDDHTRFVAGTMNDRFVGRDIDASSAEDLMTLGSQLRDDTNTLIKGCTMSGPAHNELHKFLGHFIPAVNRLVTSGEAASATRVHALLTIYGEHFE